MKHAGPVVALAFGMMSQGVMAKTINVVTSFSILGDITQEVGGGAREGDNPGGAGRRSAHL